MATGISNIEVRHANRQNILQIIRENGMMTKKDISKDLDLSLATVTTLLRELIGEGVVEPGETSDSTGGRKPVMYRAVANARVALGVAISRCHIRLVLATWNQEILKTGSEEILYENTEAYWEKFRSVILDFLEVDYVEGGCFKGIGICIQAIIIPGTHMESLIPVEIFEGIDFDKIKALFPCPVFFYENMKSAAFSQIGAPGKRRRTVYLTLDRLVGGAVVSDGTFWGLSDRAGEFGHMIVGEGESTCYCGKRGCLQTYCGSDVLRSKSGMDLPEFFEALEKENPACMEIWDTYMKYLVRAIYNLKVIFDIDITIGGEMVPYIRRHEKRLLEMLAQIDLYREPVNYLRFSEGGEMDSAAGAAYITLENEGNSFVWLNSYYESPGRRL